MGMFGPFETEPVEIMARRVARVEWAKTLPQVICGYYRIGTDLCDEYGNTALALPQPMDMTSLLAWIKDAERGEIGE